MRRLELPRASSGLGFNKYNAFDGVRRKMNPMAEPFLFHFDQIEAQLVRKGKALKLLSQLSGGAEESTKIFYSRTGRKLAHRVFWKWAEWWSLTKNLETLISSISPTFRGPYDNEKYLDRMRASIKIKRSPEVEKPKAISILSSAPLLTVNGQWRTLDVHPSSPGKPIFWIKEPEWEGEYGKWDEHKKRRVTWSWATNGITLDREGKLWKQPAFYHADTNLSSIMGGEYPDGFESIQYGKWEPIIIKKEAQLFMSNFYQELTRTFSYAHHYRAFGNSYHSGATFYSQVLEEMQKEILEQLEFSKL